MKLWCVGNVFFSDGAGEERETLYEGLYLRQVQGEERPGMQCMLYAEIKKKFKVNSFIVSFFTD